MSQDKPARTSVPVNAHDRKKSLDCPIVTVRDIRVVRGEDRVDRRVYHCEDADGQRYILDEAVAKPGYFNWQHEGVPHFDRADDLPVRLNEGDQIIPIAPWQGRIDEYGELADYEDSIRFAAVS